VARSALNRRNRNFFPSKETDDHADTKRTRFKLAGYGLLCKRILVDDCGQNLYDGARTTSRCGVQVQPKWTHLKYAKYDDELVIHETTAKFSLLYGK